jgi:hypothetical protein
MESCIVREISKNLIGEYNIGKANRIIYIVIVGSALTYNFMNKPDSFYFELNKEIVMFWSLIILAIFFSYRLKVDLGRYVQIKEEFIAVVDKKRNREDIIFLNEIIRVSVDNGRIALVSEKKMLNLPFFGGFYESQLVEELEKMGIEIVRISSG